MFISLIHLNSPALNVFGIHGATTSCRCYTSRSYEISFATIAVALRFSRMRLSEERKLLGRQYRLRGGVGHALSESSIHDTRLRQLIMTSRTRRVI
jgi:hypothetical protein